MAGDNMDDTVFTLGFGDEEDVDAELTTARETIARLERERAEFTALLDMRERDIFHAWAERDAARDELRRYEVDTAVDSDIAALYRDERDAARGDAARLEGERDDLQKKLNEDIPWRIICGVEREQHTEVIASFDAALTRLENANRTVQDERNAARADAARMRAVLVRVAEDDDAFGDGCVYAPEAKEALAPDGGWLAQKLEEVVAPWWEALGELIYHYSPANTENDMEDVNAWRALLSGGTPSKVNSTQEGQSGNG